MIRIPESRPWGEVYGLMRRQWDVGQHLAMVGKTRSGKTTFAREVLALRDWVVVFGTKPKDEVLYAGFEERGYVIRDKWSPDDLSANRVIYRPAGGGLRDTAPQKRAFAEALDAIYETGGWTIYIDEVLVLAVDLGLDRILNRMWTQAASNQVTMVAGTQRPRGAPQNMWQQSEWLAFWRIPDQEDRYRAAEFTGDLRGLSMEAMAILPRYELLLVNTATDRAVRTKVRGA